MKNPSVSILKKRCWKIFSLYIRKKYLGEDGLISCVTCFSRHPIEQIHAGHFVPGRGNSILFDERGVFPQCYVCNVPKHGNTLAYLDFMRSHYGEKAEEIIQELRTLAKQPKKFTKDELRELINKYTVEHTNKEGEGV